MLIVGMVWTVLMMKMMTVMWTSERKKQIEVD